MMAASTNWQLAQEAARRYEEVLVPAILGPAARALVDWAALQPGETVVDVGCGTGAATCPAAEHVGPSGRVVGIDVSASMLDVARSRPLAAGAPIDWQASSAASLPLADGSADVVLCAQTLQFIDDREAALREMHRVLRPDGRVALSVWCEIEESPYFRALAETVASHLGAATAGALYAAFALPHASALHALLARAGFHGVEIRARQLDLLLPPATDFVPRHIAATPMVAGFEAAPAAARRAVVEDVSRRLASHETAAGVAVPFRTHFALATKG